MTIGFNPRYIMDVLSTLKEDQAELYLNDASSPVLIKTQEIPCDNFVVRPVRVWVSDRGLGGGGSRFVISWVTRSVVLFRIIIRINIASK